MDAYALTAATVVTQRKIRRSSSILIEEGKIAGFARGAAIELPVGEESCVYPALINCHDHLRGNYLPRVGPPQGSFYPNWSPWNEDLRNSEVFKERSAISIAQMYLLGGYKNLFSGVATVNDHFPHSSNAEFLDTVPIRAIKEYCLAHECSSYDLKWGEGLEIEHRRAIERGWPFITHLEEGFDPESMDGVGVLERAEALDERDLLVHCIGFSDEDVKKIRKAGASVAWCPASNYFMFNCTCKIRKLLRAGVNVALGTDSTHTGSVNLLAEMKFARSTYQKLYGEDLPAKTLFEMVSVNAAKALGLAGRSGVLEPGSRADIAVFRSKIEDPYENLAAAECEDLEFLSIDGRPVYALESKYASLVEAARAKNLGEYGRVIVGGRAVLVAGDPAALLRDIRTAVGFAKKLDYLPFEI